jgi:hypothetical protein
MKLTSSDRAFQALDSIRASAKWLDRSRDDVAQWLNEWEKSTKA